MTELEFFRVGVTLVSLVLLLMLDFRARRASPERPAQAGAPRSFGQFMKLVWLTLVVLLAGWVPLNPWRPALLSGAWLLTGSLLFILWSRLTLGRNYTPCDRARLPGEIVRHGPYRWIRHPLYTGYLLHWLALNLVFPSTLVLGLTLALALAYPGIARQEEFSLRESFPDYADYQRRTSAFLPWPLAVLLGIGLFGLLAAWWWRPPARTVGLVDQLGQALSGPVLAQRGAPGLLRFWLSQLAPLPVKASGELSLNGHNLGLTDRLPVDYLVVGENRLDFQGRPPQLHLPPRPEARGRSLIMPAGSQLEFAVEPHQGARLGLDGIRGRVAVSYASGGRAARRWLLEGPGTVALPRARERGVLGLAAEEEVRLENPRLEFWEPAPTSERAGPSRPSIVLIIHHPSVRPDLPEGMQYEHCLAYSEAWRENLRVILGDLPARLALAGYQTLGVNVPPEQKVPAGYLESARKPYFFCQFNPRQADLDGLLQALRERGDYRRALIVAVGLSGADEVGLVVKTASGGGGLNPELRCQSDVPELILAQLGLAEPVAPRPVFCRRGQARLVVDEDWRLTLRSVGEPPLELSERRGGPNQFFQRPEIRNYLWAYLKP